MADVVAKAISDKPLKFGDAVALWGNRAVVVREGETVSDDYLTDEEAAKGGKFRHRLYYTTGGPDP